MCSSIRNVTSFTDYSDGLDFLTENLQLKYHLLLTLKSRLNKVQYSRKNTSKKKHLKCSKSVKKCFSCPLLSYFKLCCCCRKGKLFFSSHFNRIGNEAKRLRSFIFFLDFLKFKRNVKLKVNF